MTSNNPLRIAIIGGVAAGAKTAAKARREDPHAEITIYTEEAYISYAGCGEPYYIGGEVSDREQLLQRSPQDFLREHQIVVKPLHRVTKIRAQEKKIDVLNIQENHTFTVEFDVLVIATGASSIIPKLPGVALPGVFKLRTIPDTDAIREKVDSGTVQNAVVVGGGYIGLEMIEQLTHRGIAVTCVERMEQLAPPYDSDVAHEVKMVLENHGVKVMLNSALEEIIGSAEEGVRAVKVAGQEIATDMVLLSVGIRPNVELAREAGIEIGPTGAIRVNEYLQTNYPYIYAAGDCSEMVNRVTGKPVWVALGHCEPSGASAGINVTGGQEKFPGIVGTSIFRVFDLNVAGTGLIEREARKQGYDIEVAVVPQTDKPGYMPGAKSVIVKLIAEKSTQRLLGAEVWGPGNVDKVIDTLATALVFNATITDLTHWICLCSTLCSRAG